MIHERLREAGRAELGLAAPQQSGGGAELRKRRRFDLQAVPLEQTGVDRDEQREIGKGAAVRQKQFSHRKGGDD
jgi:hypothetical protein